VLIMMRNMIKNLVCYVPLDGAVVSWYVCELLP
jgi:hypothetical protein